MDFYFYLLRICQAALGIAFLFPYPSHTHRKKTCGNPHRTPIPTEPRTPCLFLWRHQWYRYRHSPRC